tara:strand:- start:1559 stop:2215 length:657 start_codon:yes stop_codon:yes gene_type:complete
LQRDFVILLAWPEGMVSAANSWYDIFFSNKDKKYRVGHSAIILINSSNNRSHYFDFGRYHTPLGYGRVRDEETDPNLVLQDVKIKSNKIINLKSLLLQVAQIKSTYGEGRLYASLMSYVCFKKAYKYAKSIQNMGALKYGPFTINGTNCSRFTASVAISSNPKPIKKFRFKYPFCISPSPKRNVSIANNIYYVVDGRNVEKIKKTKIKNYFSSIESWV